MKESEITKEKIMTVLQSAITNMRINISCLNGRTDIIKTPFYQVGALLQECIRMCSQNSIASRMVIQKVLIPLMLECSKNLDDVLKDSLQLRSNYDKLKRHNSNFRLNRVELLRLIRVYDPYAGNPTSDPVTLGSKLREERSRLPERIIVVDQYKLLRDRSEILKELEELSTGPDCYFTPLQRPKTKDQTYQK